MIWLKLFRNTICITIVILVASLSIDWLAPRFGMAQWLPNRQHAHQEIELQFYKMWLVVEQVPPKNTASFNLQEKSAR
jgi:hypothetical protein